MAKRRQFAAERGGPFTKTLHAETIESAVIEALVEAAADETTIPQMLVEVIEQ